MKKILILTTGSVAALCLLGMPTTAVHAARYQVISNQAVSRTAPYHNAVTGSQFVWNLAHTAKLHNLNNFPTTTWALKRVAVLSHNGIKARYFNVINRTGQSGWVWHGFLKPGAYQYHEDPNADGLNLVNPANSSDVSMLSNYILQKLFAAGYRGQPDLMKLTRYYGIHHLNTTNFSLKDAVAKQNLAVDPDKIASTMATPVSNLADLIDPKTGDLLLENTGNGELGNQLTAQIETFLKANQAHDYGLWLNLSGSTSDGTLTLSIIYMALKP